VIDIIKKDSPAAGLVKTCDQVDNGTFAGPGRADNADGPVPGKAKTNIF